MHATMTQRGSIVEKELKYIQRRSRVLFKDVEIDPRDEFRNLLREKQRVFVVKVRSMLGFFAVMVDSLDDWRRAIFRGEDQLRENDESCLKRSFLLWLEIATSFKERAEFYTRHNVPLESQERFRLTQSITEAQRLLKNWQRPVLSRNLSLRTRKLSPGAEAKFRQSLERTATK